MSELQAMSVRAAYFGDLDTMRKYQNKIYNFKFPNSSSFRGTGMHTSPSPIVDTVLAGISGKNQHVVNDGVIALTGMQEHFQKHGYNMESIFRGIGSFSKGDMHSSVTHFRKGGMDGEQLYTMEAKEMSFRGGDEFFVITPEVYKKFKKIVEDGTEQFNQNFIVHKNTSLHYANRLLDQIKATIPEIDSKKFNIEELKNRIEIEHNINYLKS